MEFNFDGARVESAASSVQFQPPSSFIFLHKNTQTQRYSTGRDIDGAMVL